MLTPAEPVGQPILNLAAADHRRTDKNSHREKDQHFPPSSLPDGQQEGQSDHKGYQYAQDPWRPLARTEDVVDADVSIGESLWKGVLKTGDIAVFSLKMLGKMLVGEVSWKHLSGPVTIADFAGQSASMGWVPYITFLALISISLGVLNLLPIPLLDGGHLMYYLVEIVKGRPLSERAMELGQRVGLALLLVMMAFAFYNDLNRLLTG